MQDRIREQTWSNRLKFRADGVQLSRVTDRRSGVMEYCHHGDGVLGVLSTGRKSGQGADKENSHE